MGYACSELVMSKKSSPELAGTIVNRGFFWRRVIHHRILRLCRKQADLNSECSSSHRKKGLSKSKLDP